MPLRIAVVGTGTVAREQYIPFLASQKDVTLSYFNRTAETARQMAAKFGGDFLADLSEVPRWNPTSVMVLVSETARFEIGKALVESGVPRIFFEKPLVAAKGQAHVSEVDFQNGKLLLDMAKARGCETAIVFNYRFFQQTVAAKMVVKDRKFGKVTSVTGLVHYACWSHAIDLIRVFAGDVIEITALAGDRSHASPELNISANDVAAAFKFHNAATGTIIGSAALKWQHPLYELIFTFENGRMHMRDLDGTLEILDGSGNIHESISLSRHNSRWSQYAESFGNSVGAYLQSLRENKPPPVPAIEGLKELQFEAALKRSIKEKKPVNLTSDFPI